MRVDGNEGGGSNASVDGVGHEAFMETADDGVV